MVSLEGGRSEVVGRRFYLIMAVLMAVEVLSNLPTSMIYSALPAIMREFNDPVTTGWILTAFLLVQAGSAAIGPPLGDRYGRKRLLLIVVATTAFGCLISAVAPTLPLIILGRAVQGLSGAILPLCYGIARQVSPPHRTSFWISILTGAWGFSAAFGYIVGGYLSDAGDWRAIFWSAMAYALALMPLVLLVAPRREVSASARRLDVLGGVLFVPAIAGLLYSVVTMGKAGANTNVWGWFFASAGLLIFWGWYEVQRTDPLIDVKLLRQPPIAVGNVCSALSSVGAGQLPLVSLMLLQQPVATGVGLGVGAAMAAILKLPSNLGSLAGSVISGIVCSKYDSRGAILLGGILGILAYGAMALFHASIWEVAAGATGGAFANTIVSAAFPNLVLENAPRERSSEVTGLTIVVRGIFAAIGTQIATGFLASSRVTFPGAGASFPSQLAYQRAFGFITLTMVCIVAVILLERLRLKLALSRSTR